VAPVCEVLSPEFLGRVVGSLFPLRTEGGGTELPDIEWDPAWDVTGDEVVAAIKRMSAGVKAPGPDGV